MILDVIEHLVEELYEEGWMGEINLEIKGGMGGSIDPKDVPLGWQGLSRNFTYHSYLGVPVHVKR